MSEYAYQEILIAASIITENQKMLKYPATRDFVDYYDIYWQ